MASLLDSVKSALGFAREGDVSAPPPAVPTYVTNNTSSTSTPVTMDTTSTTTPVSTFSQETTPGTGVVKDFAGNPIEPVFPEADAVLARLLASQTVTSDTDGTQVTLAPKGLVTTVGGWWGQENIRILIDKPGIERIGLSAAGKGVLQALEKIKGLEEHFDFKAAEAETDSAHDKPEILIAAFRAALESNPSSFTDKEKEGYLAWFEHEAKQNNGHYYGRCIGMVGGSEADASHHVRVDFNVHGEPGASKDGLSLTQTSVANITARKNDILAHVVTEATKEMQAVNEKFKAAHADKEPPFSAKDLDDLKALDFVIKENYGITLYFGPPKAADVKCEDDKPESKLGPTSLTKLDGEILHRIVTHAVLKVGKDAADVVPILANATDIKEELKAKVADVPALAAVLEKSPFAGVKTAEELAKENDKPVKSVPRISKSGDRAGAIEITLDCPKGKPATDIIKIIAAATPTLGSFTQMVVDGAAARTEELQKLVPGAAPVPTGGAALVN